MEKDGKAIPCKHFQNNAGMVILISDKNLRDKVNITW